MCLVCLRILPPNHTNPGTSTTSDRIAFLQRRTSPHLRITHFIAFITSPPADLLPATTSPGPGNCWLGLLVAVRAVLVHFDRRPNLASAAGLLEERSLRTEGCEDGLGVAAGVAVGVVLAHDCEVRRFVLMCEGRCVVFELLVR